MAKAPKPFTFTLTPAEAAFMTGTSITGRGGRQSLQRKIRDQLDASPYQVVMMDDEFGMLCRYIGQYRSSTKSTKGGGSQDRFRNAFARSLKDLLQI